MFDELSKMISPEPNSGCWIWLGATKGRRYGKGPSRDYAHRDAYRSGKGPIPVGLSVLHRCDTPLCVNHKHLFLGTQSVNMADMKAKGRHPGNTRTRPQDRPRAKLSPEIAEYIRQSKEGPVALAKQLGVHRQTILRVRKRVSYLDR